MTTRYHLPEGANSVSADGLTFVADHLGQIDVAGAYPTTVATLMQYAGITPVRTEEDIEHEKAEAAELVRFKAAVADMMRGDLVVATVRLADVQAALDLEAAEEAAAKEAATAERTVREALLAAAEVEAVAAEEAETETAGDARGVMPPKRRKNA